MLLIEQDALILDKLLLDAPMLFNQSIPPRKGNYMIYLLVYIMI